ncbi:MAG: hypothetical protein R2766_04850 [Saprospiraceae bacterium]
MVIIFTSMEGNQPINDRTFLYKTDKNGTIKELIELTFDDPNYILPYNKSLVVFENYIIVYGSFDDASDLGRDGNPKVKGYQFWINKSDLNIDTLIMIEPPLISCD